MSKKNKDIIRHAIEEIWHNRNLSIIDELYATDFVNHSLPSGYAQDLESEKKLVSAFHTAFPDFKFTIDDMIAEGDKVVMRGNWCGTHEGEFMGLPPTSKRVTVTEIAIFRLAWGKIAELWANTDLWSLMKQLGGNALKKTLQ
jgi:steroid delta-isomerase-like uncharacterized protein